MAGVYFLNPGQVPVLPYDPRYVYPPGMEKARRFLTNLPAPTRVRDGWMRCGVCDGKIPADLVTTHVPGSSPVRMAEDHVCRAKAGV